MTQEVLLKEVKRIFIYDRDKGELRRKIRPANCVKVGDKSSNRHRLGYYEVCIKGKKYLTHRIIWLIENGELPRGQIDHINHNKRDNKINNLRVVTHQENSKNLGKQKNNKSGFTGVRYCNTRNKRCASIKVNGRTMSLGVYKDIYEAISAREDANVKYGFHENHGK